MFLILLLLSSITSYLCDPQTGPDPWDYEGPSNIEANVDIPPDIRLFSNKKEPVAATDKLGTGEWFFRRMLGIVLKGGQNKRNEDGSIDISLSMRLDEKQWEMLDKYTQSTTGLTEDMYRRSVGYIEQAIYQPSIAEKIVMAWSDYIGIYLTEYKTSITWTLACLSVMGGVLWLSKRMSQRHLVITIFITLYLYEVFVSYKEAENQELDMFIAAANKCSWQFWTSECDVPRPGLVLVTFLKHINPLKIGIRMFTMFISEPMIVFSDTLKIMLHGITDGLWFPFDKIVYGILILCFYTILLLFFVSIICNYILNVPINFGIGLVSVGFRQRRRTLLSDNDARNERQDVRSVEHADRISEPTLNRLLDVFSQALNNSNPQNHDNFMVNGLAGSSRSSVSCTSTRPVLKNVTKRKNAFKVTKRKNLPIKLGHYDGSGDAH